MLAYLYVTVQVLAEAFCYYHSVYTTVEYVVYSNLPIVFLCGGALCIVTLIKMKVWPKLCGNEKELPTKEEEPVQSSSKEIESPSEDVRPINIHTVQRKKKRKKKEKIIPLSTKKDPLPLERKETQDKEIDPTTRPLPSDSEDEKQAVQPLEPERRVDRILPIVEIPAPFQYTFHKMYITEFVESSLPIRQQFTTMKKKAFADVEYQDSMRGLKITCLLKPEQQNVREMCKEWKQVAKHCLDMIVQQISEIELSVSIEVWEKAGTVIPFPPREECIVYHTVTAEACVIHLVGLTQKVHEHSTTLSNIFMKVSDEIKQSMKEEQEKYEMMAVIIKGLNDEISRDHLKLSLERHSQCYVKEILYGMKADTALVNFSSKPDFIKLMEHFEKNPVCGVMLQLKRILKIDKIQVHAITEISDSIVELYFESVKRSGGGDVISVDQRKKVYIVKFRDPKVIHKVLSRSHTLEGKELHVDVYYEDLGVIPPYHDKLSPGFDLPVPFVFAFPSPRKAEFVKSSVPFQDEICKLMKDQGCASVDWVDSQDSQKGLKISCLLKPEQKNAREMCKEWTQNARSCLDMLVKQIDEKNLKVSAKVWQSSTEPLKAVPMPPVSECIVHSNVTARSCVICLVGLTRGIQNYSTTLSNIFKKVSDELEWKSQCVQEVYDKIKPAHVVLIEKLGLFGELIRGRQQFKINWDVHTGRIVFSGHKDDVMRAKLDLQEAILSFEEETLNLDPHVAVLLKQGPCREYVLLRFTQTDMKATWDTGIDNKLSILATDKGELSKAKKIIQSEVISLSVPVPKKSQGLFDKPNWCYLKQQMETEYQGTLRISVDPKKESVAFSGTEGSVKEGKDWFDVFLKQATVDEERLPMTTVQGEFITKHLQGEIVKLQKHYSVKIIQDKSLYSPGFQIAGVDEARKNTLDLLRKLCDSIKIENFTIKNKPGVGNLFLTERGIEKLETLEDKHKVIIKVEGGQESKPFSFNPYEASPDRAASPVFHSKGLGEPHPTLGSTNNQSERSRKVDTDSLKTKGGLTVRIGIRDLVTEKVDVIVNSTSSDLDLSNGTVSKHLLRAGGQKIQSEAFHKVPDGGLKCGAIVTTSGGKLNCASLYHCFGITWDGPNGLAMKALRTIVKNALKKMDSSGYTSIAFPAIGTGVLGYPHQTVAKTMLEEVMNYSPLKPQTMKEVRFILHPKDKKTIQAFCQAFQNESGRDLGADHMVSARMEEEVVHRMEPNTESIGVASGVTKHSRPKSSSSPNILDFMQTYSGTTVEVLAGDITEENTDAIVNSSSQNLDLHGEVSRAILAKGGSSIRDECQRIGTTTDDLLITKAGTLKCSKIIHLNAPSDVQAWSTVIMKVLKAAEQNGINSIAFPVLGTGNQSKDPKVMAGVLMKTIKTFCKSRSSSSIEMIRVVVFQRHMVQEFSAHLRSDSPVRDLPVTAPVQHKYISPNREQIDRSMTRQHIKPKTERRSTSSPFHMIECKSTVKLLIYVSLQKRTDISKVKEHLTEFAEKECESKKLDSEYYQTHISDLGENEIDKIQNLEKLDPVKITIQQQRDGSYILLQGLNADISSVTEKIMKILHELDMAAKIKDLTKTIQWKYENGDRWESYPEDINFSIEEAFKKELPSVTWKEKDGNFVVSLSAMTEENCKTNIIRYVKRVDLTKDTIDIPANWSKMEATDDVKQETLDASNVEYKAVAKKFSKYVPGTTIISIKRIQNPGLYKPFMLKKNIMENSLPKGTIVMRELWHGTSADTIDDINRNSFNRNYAGKNGTAFGKGVYFACDASYSANRGYCSPDLNGHKHIYLALVLTGEYTRGDSGLLAPPSKDPANPTLRYDSVVDNVNDPSMFVIFHDTHVYPKFLITFQ